MAALKNPHRFLEPSPAAATGFDGDFEESDIWGFGPGFGPEPRADDRRNPIPARRSGKKKKEKGDRAGGAAGSLPVNIPDWSKILKEENRGIQFLEFDEGDEEVIGSGSVIPPHEMLWMRREASFSVQEGIGRTLKGRDLSRVRDAVWRRTGFQA